MEIIKDYEEKLNIIELINNNTFKSLRIKAEKKIDEFKKMLSIKKALIKSFHQYSNFIIGKNIISLLITIPDLSYLNISNKNKNYNINESHEIIELFLKKEKFIKFDNIKLTNKFFDEFTMTKTCLDKNKMNENKFVSKIEIFHSSYLNVINLNLETSDSIVYNILANDCFAQKITPIQFNYNKLSDSINNQEILMYNINNDQSLYYGIYNISKKCIVENSTIKLLNGPITKFKCINLNYGDDLFIIQNILDTSIILYYLSNFRNNLKIK